ncbi:membrane-targeted effector domain-containing toxin [Pseudomonas fluorescens]|uniref:Toxin n=1 Tax=Pseudomonas fluorescens TaxID=294 RepID=A0A5E7EQ30_PSEFL|nr:membrane-targeted effector domain-containing toxin [Pseudomonas fluorescens]VVO28985.1 hypothetical protein PS691_04786 [Pseudomonas fluorescens]
MSTSRLSTSTPSFEEIKGYLYQIGHHLLEPGSSPQPKPGELVHLRQLLTKQPPAPELAHLQQLNATLKTHNQTLFSKSHELYQALAQTDLKHTEGSRLLASLKTELNQKLQALDERSLVDGKGRRSFMANEAGATALEQEARLNVKDRLLLPDETRLVDGISLGPAFRPGLYALTFSYQDQTVELAGAFVLTEKNNPIATSLTLGQSVGKVLLFIPSCGLKSFSSLEDMNTNLLESMEAPLWRNELMNLLPRRYQHLGPAGIWPLELSQIDGEPLFEHTYDTLLAKRTLDIDRALSLEDNPTHSARQLVEDLDRAVRSALPDLSARLELRAQTLLDRCLNYSAPDWYRSADESKRAELAQHLARYNNARQTLIDLFGPAATPQALSRYQLIERLSDELDIDDLDPDQLHVSTYRKVAAVGDYEQKHSLTRLALRGLHTGDELADSDFIKRTTITYAGAPLAEQYQSLTPTWLATWLATLQPRLDFATVQKNLHGEPQIKSAIERMLDLRINALAYVAMLQNHLTEDDYQLIQTLRQGTDIQLKAATVSLQQGQFGDLWLLRQTDDHGAVKRLLLCTPEAPGAQQFRFFNSEVACKAHILGWSQDPVMKGYLIDQVALRFRPAMAKILTGLGFRPHDQEYQKVTFSTPSSHDACLKAAASHMLATREDDYTYGTPLWYTSASAAERKQLTSLAEDAEGALENYSANPLSDIRFISFERYVHGQAKNQLNQLLGRRQNDIDPDTVLAHYPQAFPGLKTPQSLTYTQLFRDGYEDYRGFLDAKFDRSATFTAPTGIDLSNLTAENVAISVRGVWIGQRYTDEIKARLQNTHSTGYTMRRDATLAITQLQMRNAALESRLKGHIASVDLDWLEQTINAMGDTSPQTRESYQIHRLFVDGEWVIDNFLFKRGNDPVLLYTPQAPDGIAFREARRFNYLLKETDGMVGYLSSRVGVQAQTRVRAFLENAKQQLPKDLTAADLSVPRYDPITRETVVFDLLQPLYNAKLQRKIDNVQATTVNRQQMIMDLLWSCLEPLVAIATAPYPVLSLGVGMLLAFKDGMLALHAYNQGDSSAALQHYIGYLLNTAGAVFTDLRPALKSAITFSKPTRYLLRTPQEAHAVALIKQLEPTTPTPAGMQSVLFEGQQLWAAHTPDALGRYLLWRLDPVTGQLNSTARLVNKTDEGRWVRSGVSGGAPTYQKLPEADNPLKDYEVPQEHWRNFESILNPNFKKEALDSPSFHFGEQLATSNLHLQLEPLRKPYLASFARLSKDADAFFDNLQPIVPRADVLTFETSATHSHIIEKVLKENTGLILGATPDSIAGKEFLHRNMQALYDNGVRRLYIEYLPRDVFRAKLNQLNSGKASWHIDQHLKRMDAALGIPAGSTYSYRALVQEARRLKIEVHGLDASTCYRLDDVLDLADVSPTTPRSNTQRNFYSHKVIEADVAANPDDRWVALVEPSRMGTYDQVPGLADLQKTISIRLEDVAPGQPTGISKDAAGAIDGDPMAKGDFKLTLQTAYQRPAQVPPQIPATPPAGPNYSEFDIAPQFREHIRELASEHRGLDTRYSSRNTERRLAKQSFQETRDRLKIAADGFFRGEVTVPRPTLPSLTPPVTHEGFLNDIFKNASGLIIGEAHSGQSSKAFLIKYMGELKRRGVKTLYVEHLLTDLHQADLNVFYQTGKLSDRLKNYLKQQDRGHMFRYIGLKNYSSVIEAAGKHGIRVRALDCAASYHLKGMSEAQTPLRIKMFNYFANEVIRTDQLAEGPHKWVAFMGSSHTDTYQGIPGIAQLQDAISLHIHDTAPSLAKELCPGGWAFANEPLYPNRWTALRSDFKIEVATVGDKAPPPVIPIDRTRLKSPGHFMIEKPTEGEANLVHHSGSGEIISTPIQVDDTGLLYIDRWDSIREKRYLNLAELINDLTSVVHLTQIS